MDQFITLLNKGKSPYHVVALCKKQLEQAGFTALDYRQSWDLEFGASYYVSPYPSVLFAFTTGSAMTEEGKIKIALAHTDFPCFKLKSHPEYTTEKYLQVNVEPYGGMIQSTWFDRPLGLVGKVMLVSDDVYAPKTILFESAVSLFVIPSLAPHLDKNANGKHEYDMQQELQPVAGLLEEQCNKDDFVLEYLAKELGVKKEDIVSFDLFLCNMDQAEKVGLQGEFISAPRIDNLASVAALVEGMTVPYGKGTEDGISMIALFDNEEIGSRSKQGADSALMTQVIEKIGQSFGKNHCEMNDMLARGFLLSVDGAQAFHPNYITKSDPTNEIYLGSGVTIKTSASQRYVTDSEATAIVMQLCKQANVKCQLQVNRSGMPGGQTLGPIAVSYLPMQGADIGIPMLAMHSARELAAGADYKELVKLIKAFL